MHESKKRGIVFHKVDKLGMISLLSNISIALVATIWAIYLESILKNISYVGFLTGFFTFIGIFASIFFVPIIEKHNKAKIYSISILIFILSYLLFSVTSNIWIVVFLGLLITITSVIRITSFGIILRDNSNDVSVSKNLGLVYTFFNLAWFIGPLIGGFVAEKYNLKSVFILAAGIMLLTLILFNFFKIRDNRVSKKIDLNLFKLVRDFLKDRNRLTIYFLGGGITFWNTLIYVYMPIHIVNLSNSDLLVGYFLSASIIPLIFLEYFFGKLTGKVGFKKIFFIGYLILSAATITTFFISNLYVVLAVIIIGSVGISMLESTTESYFFDIVKKDERDKFYGPYNTTIEVNSLIASVSIAGILLILPFKFVFLFVGIIMFLLALVSLRIKNIVETKKH